MSEKAIFITDQHFGVRQDSILFDDYFRKFYEEFFFPYVDKHNIKTIIDGGDTFDRRKYISFATLKRCREYWFDEVRKRDIQLHMNIGNHSTPFKNSLEGNSPSLLLRDYDNVVVYDVASDLQLGKYKFGMIPWICPDNFQSSMKYIEETDASHLMVHMDIAGFEMHKGQVSEHGFDMKMFSRFDTVFSGHYHTRSQRNNIFYLGAPYEMTWADYDDPRGFHVFDMETGDVWAVDNPYSIFVKFYYDDSRYTLEEMMDMLPDVEGCYVKLVVQSKNNPYWLELIEDKMNKSGAQAIQKIEHSIWLDELEELTLDEVEDTLTLLKKYCIQSDTKHTKELEKFMTNLYEEALNHE